MTYKRWKMKGVCVFDLRMSFLDVCAERLDEDPCGHHSKRARWYLNVHSGGLVGEGENSFWIQPTCFKLGL